MNSNKEIEEVIKVFNEFKIMIAIKKDNMVYELLLIPDILDLWFKGFGINE